MLKVTASHVNGYVRCALCATSMEDAQGGQMRPLGVGDTVKVLRAARLPVEDVLGIGPIERISRATSGENLYWVRGFACARSERELRRWKSMAEVQAEREDALQEGRI